MTPVLIVILSSVVCWGTLCLSFALARRSWTDLLAVGGILTLLFSILVKPFPHTAATMAVIVNGGFLLTFLVTVARHAWSLWRSGRDG